MAMKQDSLYRALKQGVSITAKDSVFVGLDVHKRSFHVAVRINGEFWRALVIPASPAGVCDWLKPLRLGLKQVVYEAGPTGYGLVRELRSCGYPAQVIDPSKMPRPAGQGNKSDGLDCRRLAELAEKGILPFVAVPSEEEEARRQVVRLREQVMRKQRRVKQQIKSFLLVHGLEEPAGLRNWTKASVLALQSQVLGSDLRFSLDVLLAELAQLTQQSQSVTVHIREMGREAQCHERVERLCSHPGVGELTAMIFLSEVRRPERFENKSQLACYLGLAPQVRQSGETWRGGPTLKAGQGTLRSKLIEASWIWIRQDEQACATFGRLCRNTGSAKKAIVGMARRMAINLWMMAVSGESYRFAA